MKSEFADQLEIMRAVYEDARMQCTAVVSDLRDLDYIKARVESEGLSFLTISLPSFCADFERSLAEEKVSASAFRSFRKSGAIPAFLQGMLGRLFDRETGRIIDFEADHPPIVQAIRQICLLFKKVELECSPKRKAKALANYVDVELLNERFVAPGPDDPFYRISDMLWGSVFSGFNPESLLPKHGPGAVVEGNRGNAKYLWQRWHESLEQFLPFWQNALPARAAGEEEFENVTFVSREDEDPVRVIFVPKTLKSPRVIAIEPMCNQYAQQALRDFLYDRIESHSLTKGRINFRDQSINQRLALTSSETGRYATLDLSDASDRVPLSVVTEMLRSTPELRDAILACRSESAKLPNGVVIRPLAKFASMGSALCFPIEAVYFYTVIVDALIRKYDLPVTWGSIKRVSLDIRVYGDDLIVRSEDAVAIRDNLQKYNCKVNENKSFQTGRFRESCGVDAYAGLEVTPLYLRQRPPTNRRDTRQILAWVSLGNAFSRRGYNRSAHLVYSTVEKLLGPLPEVPHDSGVIGRVSVKPGLNRSTTKWRYNPLVQTIEILVWTPSPVLQDCKIDGWPALQKCLLKLEHATRADAGDAFKDPFRVRAMLRQSLTPFGVPWLAGYGWLIPLMEIQPSIQDPRHLERHVVRGALTLKRRWVPFNT